MLYLILAVLLIPVAINPETEREIKVPTLVVMSLLTICGVIVFWF